MGAKEDKVLKALMKTRAWGNHGVQSPEVMRELKKETFRYTDPALAAAIAAAITPEIAAEIAKTGIKELCRTAMEASLAARPPPRTDWQEPALDMAAGIRANNQHYFIRNIRFAILRAWPKKVKDIDPPAERALDDFLSDCIKDERLKPRTPARKRKTKP